MILNQFINNLYKSFIIYNDLIIGVLISVIVVIISMYFLMKYNTTLSMKLFSVISKPTVNPVEGSNQKANLSDDEVSGEEDDEYFDEQRVLDNNTNISEILSQIKAAKFKAVEKTLSEDQIQTEREIERQQLANIFELLKKQEQEYNMSQMKEEEFHAQLHLYR